MPKPGNLNCSFFDEQGSQFPGGGDQHVLNVEKQDMGKRKSDADSALALQGVINGKLDRFVAGSPLPYVTGSTCKCFVFMQ